ncbi:APC amino acid permease [Pluteus cervinus]|uniref:APC amino acid permease n=1 Tax=Pluteus cervinus TaxID=181527 RepID=A0ACD3AJV4_9AGAR|nr:APC amino acid permease [Pluteus cervinus]
MGLDDAPSQSETQPLLSSEAPSQPFVGTSASDGAALHRNYDGQGPTCLLARHGEAYDNIPQHKRQLGFFSTVFLIFNKIIGTGIYATPSIILRASGSVGVTLLIWVLGSTLAAVGTAVYIELGTGLPRSGGDKNYLEFMYRRPKYLVTCMYSIYAFLVGSAGANALVFGEYSLHALALTPSGFNTLVAAVLVLTFCVVMHGCFLKWGIRLQNALGLFKLVVLSSVAVSGVFCLAGVPGFSVRPEYEVPRNFEWKNMWNGSGTGANAFVMALYNVLWSFNGYANANSSLSEIKDPVRTLKRAAPTAMIFVTFVYMFVNIAYFAVVSKTDILESKRIVAALFFRNLFGPTTERALSGFIALSVLGNLLSGQFAQARSRLVIQELGREGILPKASFFSSNKPFNAPLAALVTQFIVSCAIMLGPPAGDAYLFMVSLSSYSTSLVFTFVSLGLLLLYTPAYSVWDWDPPYRSPRVVTLIFFLSNVFLVVVPLIPPTTRVYERLPYWLHPVASLSVSLVGLAYWYIWSVVLPRKYDYKLERVWVMQDDGVSRFAFRKVSKDISSDQEDS